MSDNTEFPTADRLQELRQKGLVSYSTRSGACLLVAALSVAALAVPSVLKQFSDLFLLRGTSADWNGVGTVLRDIALRWLLVPAAISLVVLTVWGLFQTRFLVNPGLSSLDFSRLLSLEALAPRSLMRRLGSALFGFFVASLGALFLLKMVGVQIFRSLHRYGAEQTVASLQELNAILPILILISSLTALMLLLVEKLRFALANRMSRKEVLAEQQG